jgi:hypothetical protein
MLIFQGLEGKADRAKAGVVRVAGLEEYIYDRVKELTDGKQKPMVAKPKMIENFPIVAVTHRMTRRDRFTSADRSLD